MKITPPRKGAIKGSRNNYLALIIITLFFSFNANAQWQKPNNATGIIYNGISTERILLFPTGCGAPALPNTIDSARLQFAIYGDSCNDKVYLYNPKTVAWSVIPSLSSLHAIDSIFLTSSDTTDTIKYIKNGSVYIAGVLSANRNYAKSPVYWDGDTLKFKKDTLPRLNYDLSIRDTSTWIDQTLVDKGYLNGRLAAFVTGVITRQELIDTAAEISGRKQDNLTLTTTGTGGPAILIGSTLNIPQYSGGSGGTTADSTLTATTGQTAFTFSSVPASTKDYIIFINGNATTNFTASGDTITVGMTDLLEGDKVRYKRIK